MIVAADSLEGREGRTRLLISQLPVTVVLALSFVVLVILTAIFGESLTPQSPTTQHLLTPGLKPSAEYWLGTDELGRDIFARVIVGTRDALFGPSLVAVSGLIVSSLLGIAAGYLGGVIDVVISRWVDFMFALPSLLVVIVVVAVFQGGFFLAIAVLSVYSVQGDIRIVRAAALEQRALPYIQVLRTFGITKRRIMFWHILPNILPIVVANFALDFAFALVSLAGLSFLGLGSPPGSPEWGRMLSENQVLLFSNPAAPLVPGGMIVLLAMTVTLVGDWIYERFAGRGGLRAN